MNVINSKRDSAMIHFIIGGIVTLFFIGLLVTCLPYAIGAAIIGGLIWLTYAYWKLQFHYGLPFLHWECGWRRKKKIAFVHGKLSHHNLSGQEKPTIEFGILLMSPFLKIEIKVKIISFLLEIVNTVFHMDGQMHF